MYLDIYFNTDDDLDEFLEDVEKEIEAQKDDVIVVDLVVELEPLKYKNFYEEIPLCGDFEAKKDEAMELIKTEIEKLKEKNT